MMAIARTVEIVSEMGMDFPFLEEPISVLTGKCSCGIAGMHNHAKNDGADSGESQRNQPRGGSKDP